MFFGGNKSFKIYVKRKDELHEGSYYDSPVGTQYCLNIV